MGGIYRGAGGTGDAVTDSSSEALLVTGLVVQAQTAEANAAASATAAQTAETNAETAEVNAELAETNAAASAASALSSKNAAAISETNAASSASTASTAASNASTSETNASSSATSASGSASAASTSASNASTSETNAAGSASTASAAASAALTALDNFDDRYLGAKAVEPTLDNDGNALVSGALYFNTVSNTMKVHTGSIWVDAYADGATFLAKANNLSDLPSVATARTNLGVTATGSDTTYAYRANNLSDLASASTARSNLGLGTIATQAASSVAVTGGTIDGTIVGGTTRAAGSFTDVTTTNDASISGLTVGKGGGAVATNTAFGAQAFNATATGGGNTGVGYQADASITSGTSNSAFGQFALTSNSTGSSNTGIGTQALNSNTTASYNTATGYQSLYSNTGAQNTANGYASMYTNTTGTLNVAYGAVSLYYNTTGSNNTAIGEEALKFNTTASQNTAVGYQALYANTGVGSDNTSMGFKALFGNTTGTNNTAVGSNAGLALTTGTQCSFFGRYAGNAATGSSNTLLGDAAGYLITSGASNTVLGRYSGNQGGLDIRTLSNYIVLSDGDGNPRGVFDGSGRFLLGATSQFNTSPLEVSTNSVIQAASFRNTSTIPFGIYIYYSGASPNNTSSNFIDCSDASVRLQVRSNGGIANYSANNVNLSDERTKTNITDAGNYLSKICAIPIRTFKYKDQTDNELNLGVIAQEVEMVAPELVDVSGFGKTPEDGIPLKAIYQTDMQYALMKSIQELNAKLEAQALEIATLKAK